MHMCVHRKTCNRMSVSVLFLVVPTANNIMSNIGKMYKYIVNTHVSIYSIWVLYSNENGKILLYTTEINTINVSVNKGSPIERSIYCVIPFRESLKEANLIYGIRYPDSDYLWGRGSLWVIGKGTNWNGNSSSRTLIYAHF